MKNKDGGHAYERENGRGSRDNGRNKETDVGYSGTERAGKRQRCCP